MRSFREELFMRIVVLVLLLLGAHLSLTAFAPAEAGKAWLLWPFAADSKPVLSGFGGLPAEGGSLLTAALAGLAGLAFLAAAACLFGIAVPQLWWIPLVLLAVVLSLLLHLFYAGPLSILPIAVNAALLWLVIVQQVQLFQSTGA
jgi:hypothetical protein